jgi:hypothetical protein
MHVDDLPKLHEAGCTELRDSVVQTRAVAKKDASEQPC